MKFVIVLLIAFSTTFANATDSVLYIGDSHSVGCFGATLEGALRGLLAPSSHPMEIRSSATCGSSSWSWLQSGGNTTKCGYRACDTQGRCIKTTVGKSSSLMTLMNEMKSSDLSVVVALGSNMLKASWHQTQSSVQGVIRVIKAQGARCIWIGPPQATLKFLSLEKYENFVASLKSTVVAEGCIFVDSSDKTDRGTITDPEGLHFKCAEGKSWGLKVFAEIQPLLMTLDIVEPETPHP